MSKKILFVANNAWSIFNFRKEIIQKFLSLKFEVHVISPADKYVAPLTQLGCFHHVLDFDNKSTNLLKDIRLYRQFKHFYEKISPDFIFHYVAKPNIYGSMAAARLGIPSIAVVTGLGHAFAVENWLYKLVSSLYKFAFRFPREIWFLNNDDAQLFIKKGIVKKSKVKILKGEGVNVDFYKPKEKQPNDVFTFVMTSRLIQSKGIIDFFVGIEELVKEGLNCKGYLLGTYDENHPDAIDKFYFSEFEANPNFHYIGHQDDIRPFLEMADCFVFPSFYPEGVPRSLMEAASMKLPIITTDATGCRDVVQDGVNGILIPPGDIEANKAAMKKIYHTPSEQLKEMGERGRELMILHFDVAQTVKQYEQVIEKYLAN